MKRISDVFRKREYVSEVMPLSQMSAAIAEWNSLYQNKLSGEGENSLNLAAGICSELARLTTVEFSSKISGSKRAEYLDRQYQRTIRKTRNFVELACAQGGVILKPYPCKNELYVSVVMADAFYPTEFSSDGEICGGIFFEKIFKDGYYYTRLEEHKLTGGKCIIRNSAYKSKQKNVLGREIGLTEVERWAQLEPACIIENVKRPLFVYFKMPLSNTVDTNSPLGVSAFSRAVNLIKDANTQYKNFLWEFESGKRALYLDECAIRQDEEDNPQIPDKRLYKMLSTGDDTLFKDWSPSIRQTEYLQGLDRILRSIEFNCGLAYGTLSDVQASDKTAEEIKASKQRSYATVCDIQNSLKKALFELVEVLDIYADIYEFAPRGEYSVSFNFDDSIVCDRQAEFSEKILLLEKGVIAPWEMRKWYMNEESDEAKQRIGEINEVQLCDPMA